MRYPVILILIFFVLTISLPLNGLPLPSEKEKKFDAYLNEFRNSIKFSSMINPSSDSAKREKKKFFDFRVQGRRYEPQFEYTRLSSKAVKNYRLINQEKLKNTIYSDLLTESFEINKLKMFLIQMRGRPAIFTLFGSRLYPLPSRKEIARAENFLASIKEKSISQKNFGSQKMKAILTKALEEKDLKHWQVIISNQMSANASVLPGSRKIKVRESAKFDELDAKRLIVHEIGVHACRAERGHKMPLKIFSTGLKGYLETEEGMAACNEFRNGIKTGLRLFALRLLAVHWASIGSFSEVFKKLIDHGATEEEAWKISQRVKRGLTDTGKKGCYPKDALYFKGFLKINSELKKDIHLWKRLMKYGKIGINHLPRLEILDHMTNLK